MASGTRKEPPKWLQPLVGGLTVVVLAAIVASSIGLFRGDFSSSVPVTVLSPRAGLVMNPDAKVKMRGVAVGHVESITARPDGQAEIRLALDPRSVALIPSNVMVDIAASTVFGSKYVQLVAPEDPSDQPLTAGALLTGEHVTVEINSVFEDLVAVLSTIEPDKLNESLGALAQAFNGRGEQIGQTFTDFNALLAAVEPSLPALSHDLEVAPEALAGFADAAPDLLAAADHASTISASIVAEQDNLDAFLVSLIGLANTGEDVLGANRAALTDLIHLLRPTTDLLNEYSSGLNCALGGLLPFALAAPLPDPGLTVSAAFTLGVERYRYPSNLPKVEATGGPHCMGLPDIPFATKPPFLVADTGANPWQYGNQGIVLNTDAMKQFLFGPIDGPPRNTSQIGQPG